MVLTRTVEYIETERMVMRRIFPSDFNDIIRLHNDINIVEALGGPSTCRQINLFLKKCHNQWGKYGYCYWMLFKKNNLEFIGRGGLRHVPIDSQDEVELGYVVKPQFWGQGYATELGKAAIDIAFGVLHLNRLVCFTVPSNKPSQRVMEKLGFAYERDFTYKNILHVLYHLSS